MKRKTRLTLLMALSEQQANSLAQCCGPLPVLLATLPQSEQRRIEAADTMPFEIYRQKYLSPDRLRAKRVIVEG